ncbi:MAG: hypothetical protein WB562_10140 [Candidatus Sulfotelmatobacter sp.]
MVGDAGRVAIAERDVMNSTAKYILLGLGVLSNIATLIGFWMQYITAPSNAQLRVSHLLVTIGAIVSVVIYLIVGWYIIRSAAPPRVEVEPIPSTANGAVPQKDRIHVCPDSISVNGYKARISFVIFSADALELRFCEVKVSLQGVDAATFKMESAAPLQIPAFQETYEILEGSLTPDEMECFGDSKRRRVYIEGVLQFAGNIERDFHFLTMEFI